MSALFQRARIDAKQGNEHLLMRPLQCHEKSNSRSSTTSPPFLLISPVNVHLFSRILFSVEFVARVNMLMDSRTIAVCTHSFGAAGSMLSKTFLQLVSVLHRCKWDLSERSCRERGGIKKLILQWEQQKINCRLCKTSLLYQKF